MTGLYSWLSNNSGAITVIITILGTIFAIGRWVCSTIGTVRAERLERLKKDKQEIYNLPKSGIDSWQSNVSRQTQRMWRPPEPRSVDYDPFLSSEVGEALNQKLPSLLLDKRIPEQFKLDAQEVAKVLLTPIQYNAIMLKRYLEEYRYDRPRGSNCGRMPGLVSSSLEEEWRATLFSKGYYEKQESIYSAIEEPLQRMKARL